MCPQWIKFFCILRVTQFFYFSILFGFVFSNLTQKRWEIYVLLLVGTPPSRTELRSKEKWLLLQGCRAFKLFISIEICTLKRNKMKFYHKNILLLLLSLVLKIMFYNNLDQLFKNMLLSSYILKTKSLWVWCVSQKPCFEYILT